MCTAAIRTVGTAGGQQLGVVSFREGGVGRFGKALARRGPSGSTQGDVGVVGISDVDAPFVDAFESAVRRPSRSSVAPVW